MRLTFPKQIRRTLTIASATLTTVLMMASPAMAHVPVMLDQTDVLPWESPLAVDGTDMVGFLGTEPYAGAVRSAQFNIQAGQTIYLNYLTRGVAPEVNLPNDKLPVIFMIAPNGHIDVIEPVIRVAVGPPGFELLQLNDFSETAPATGTYSLMIVGRAPARFSVALGAEREDAPFHGILRGTVATDAQIQAWFNTAP